MKRAGLVLLLGLGALSTPSCGGNDEVTVVLLDPCVQQDGVSFREASAFTELLLVKGGCPSDDKLVAGDVQNVAAHRIAESDGSLPSLGDVPKEKYGFTVLLKDPSCGVVGFGCTEADMESIREVRIAVRAWADAMGPRACPSCDTMKCPSTPARACCQPLSGGSCPIPLVCTDGRCAEQQIEGGAKGCDLTVLKAGVLPKLLAEGNQLTGPGVVGTNAGFVIGYRETSSDGKMRATLIPLTESGSLGVANRKELTGCVGKMPADSIATAFANGQGLLAMSLPDCGDGKGAGAAFVPFDPSGTPAAEGFPKNPNFSELTLARHAAVAPAATGTWEFLYRSVSAGSPTIQRAFVSGNSIQPNPTPVDLFPGGTFGMVVSSGQARAFIAAVPGEAGTATTVQFSVPSAGEPPTIVGERSLPSAEWAAATAWNNRVAVAVPATAGLSWLAASVSGTGVSDIVASAVLGTGTVVGADVVAHLDNLLFALGQAGKITVYRFVGASVQGVLAKTPAGDPQELSGTQMATFDGKSVAVAATGSRLAVVWLTKQMPSAAEPAGGYALLQCGDE